MAILKQSEAGTPVAELCHEHGMSNACFYKWRSRFGGMDASMMTRLKELEDENHRLKKMYAEERLKAEIIQEAMAKKWYDRVVSTLEQLIEWKGKPASIRCDSGPEYTGKILMSWAAQQNITLLFIQPGKPQQNAYIERYSPGTVQCCPEFA